MPTRPSSRRAQPIGWRWAAAVAVGVLLLTTACGLGNENAAEEIPRAELDPLLFEENPSTGPQRPDSWRLAIYLVATRDGRQVLEPVVVSLAPTLEVERALLEALLTYAPPTGSTASNLVPPGTMLRSVRQDGDVLDIDLSRFTVEGPGQAQAFAQMVFTVTQFADIRSVRFSLDGRPVAVPLGDRPRRAGQPVSRTDFADLDPNAAATNATSTSAPAGTTPSTRPGPSGSSTIRR